MKQNSPYEYQPAMEEGFPPGREDQLKELHNSEMSFMVTSI